MVLGIIINLLLSLWIIPMYLGDKRKIGLFWSLVACVFLTPIVGLIITLLSPKLEEYKKENIKQVRLIEKENQELENKTEKLKELRDKEILTEEEYDQKIKNLENLKLESQLKLSGDYKKLKSLFDDGILTKEEFEFKIDMLKNKLNTDINIDKTKLSKLSDKEIETITEIYTKTNNSSVIKQLRNKIETITNIELDLTDEKYIELIIKHREKHQ